MANDKYNKSIITFMLSTDQTIAHSTYSTTLRHIFQFPHYQGQHLTTDISVLHYQVQQLSLSSHHKMISVPASNQILAH